MINDLMMYLDSLDTTQSVTERLAKEYAAKDPMVAQQMLKKAIMADLRKQRLIGILNGRSA